MRRKIAAGLLVTLVAAVAWIALRPTPEEELAALIAELPARGEPASLADMEPPLPPDEENGAVDVDAAAAWFAEHEPPGDWESAVAGPWNVTVIGNWWESSTPVQMAALADLLARIAPMNALIDRASEKPDIAWPLPPRESASDLLEALDSARRVQELGRRLAARACGAPTS